LHSEIAARGAGVATEVEQVLVVDILVQDTLVGYTDSCT